MGRWWRRRFLYSPSRAGGVEQERAGTQGGWKEEGWYRRGLEKERAGTEGGWKRRGLEKETTTSLRAGGY